MPNRSRVKDVFDQLEDLDELDQRADVADTDTDTDTDTVDSATHTESDSASEATELQDAEPNEDSDDAGDEPTGPSRAKRILRRVGVAAIGVLVVAALGLSGYLGWQLKQVNDTAAAGRTALEAARTYAVTLTSVDSNGIDKNFEQVLDGATGDFKDMYSQSSAQLRQLLIDNKAQAKGTVVESGVKSATKTKVEVLLFIDQSITNSANPTPRIDRSRVAMTMELVGNRWLASKVDVT